MNENALTWQPKEKESEKGREQKRCHKNKNSSLIITPSHDRI